MGKVLWNKQTGEAREYEGVDAREILAASPDLYTDEAPNAAKGKNDPDGDGFEGAPQNVASVEKEFRREPVGDDPPAPERDVAIIRNPVTDTPQVAQAAEVQADTDEDVDSDGLTKAEITADLEAMKVEFDPRAKKADLLALRNEHRAKRGQ